MTEYHTRILLTARYSSFRQTFLANIESNRVKSVRGLIDQIFSRNIYDVIRSGTWQRKFWKRNIFPFSPPLDLKLLENCCNNSVSLKDSLGNVEVTKNRARSRGTNDLSTGGWLATICKSPPGIIKTSSLITAARSSSKIKTSSR